MKILYDEEKAKKKAKRNFVVDIILSSCLCISFILCICSLIFDVDYIGIVGGILLAGSYIFLRFSSPSSFPIRSAKNSDIAYLKLLEKYKILKVKTEEISIEHKKRKLSLLTINFIAENKEGIVENVFTGYLEEKMSTKVEEETVDLEKGVLYRPYVFKKERESN